MGHRLTKIYTKTGDHGTTGLGDGNRIKKNDPRMEVIGDIDELNCNVGVLLSEDLPKEVSNLLLRIQNCLFDLGGELSIPGSEIIKKEIINVIEEKIDEYNATLPPLKEFILPRGDRKTAYSHLCRGVCRRAERKLVGLKQLEEVRPESLKFLNRLSDYFFVLARQLNLKSSVEEIMWKR